MALQESDIPALVAALHAAYPQEAVHDLDIPALRERIARLQGWEAAADGLSRRQGVRILTDWIDINLDDRQRLEDQDL